MLIRITLIIAIIGGLAAGVLNIVQIKEKIITTQDARDKFHKERDEQTALKTTALKQLAATKSALEKTNALLVTTTAERDTAVTERDDLTKRNLTLTDNLKKTTEDRDSALDKLAQWNALGVPIDNIKATLASLKTVTEERDAISDEKKILLKANYVLQTKLDFILNPDHEVKLPDGLKGKVLVADPRYDFVVLNIGEKEGVIENGKMLVNRNGKLVGKVIIRSVQKDRSIANLMPGWKLGEVMEGDQVLY